MIQKSTEQNQSGHTLTSRRLPRRRRPITTEKLKEEREDEQSVEEILLSTPLKQQSKNLSVAECLNFKETSKMLNLRKG
ncbi:unnamed protein product [Trichobilharzia regenti]|nr:unnamed protein product [Trichobilharzia regenti]